MAVSRTEDNAANWVPDQKPNVLFAETHDVLEKFPFVNLFSPKDFRILRNRQRLENRLTSRGPLLLLKNTLVLDKMRGEKFTSPGDFVRTSVFYPKRGASRSKMARNTIRYRVRSNLFQRFFWNRGFFRCAHGDVTVSICRNRRRFKHLATAKVFAILSVATRRVRVRSSEPRQS